VICRFAPPPSGASLHRSQACSRPLQRYSSRSPAYPRPHVSLSTRFPRGLGCLGNPPTVPYAVDTSSPRRTTPGDSVPHHRLSLGGGPHSAPGFSGGSLGRMANRPALIRAMLAQAKKPRRLVHPHDDSTMGSSACPCTALLAGIPRRMLSDRRLSPRWGLMVSRYPRGYACTSTPEGQE
jgi:hypothetical protein